MKICHGDSMPSCTIEGLDKDGWFSYKHYWCWHCDTEEDDPRMYVKSTTPRNKPAHVKDNGKRGPDTEGDE